MSGFVRITPGNEQELLMAVATVGPVAAAVDATSPAFRVRCVVAIYSELITNAVIYTYRD